MNTYYIINVVSYFMFEGTGSKKAEYPCNSVLEIYDPENIDKWKYYKCNDNESKIKYVTKIYKRLVVSMREKGMPKVHKSICEPWIYYQDEKEKGSDENCKCEKT
jgi:hypothetical protein